MKQNKKKFVLLKIRYIFAAAKTKKNDLVAQLVEHLPFKERVLGSSPSPVTEKLHKSCEAFFME